MVVEKEDALEEEHRLIRFHDDADFFVCKTKPEMNVYVRIRFPVKGIALQKIFEAETLLNEAGVHFDTGYGGGIRDWEFDWSLEGAYVEKVKDLPKKADKKRKGNVK